MDENGNREENPEEKQEIKYDAHLQPIGPLLLGLSFDLDTMAKRPARMKTGFPKLDMMLGGGIAPGLIVLGGSPGLGKSTLALNIAEHVSSQGTPVLYYSFEMPPEKVAHKLVVRTNFLSGNEAPFTVSELFDSEEIRRWAPKKRAAYEAARKQVSKNASLIVIDASDSRRPFTAERIARHVRDFMVKHGDKEKKPLVVVDYLQILPNEDTTRTNNMRMSVEDSIRTMVNLSHEGVSVLLISSLSRGSYKKPVDLDSFKETGSIEFSADVLLAIQFSSVHEGNEVDLAAEKKKPVRDVELTILKQRYGELGEVRLDYYAQYDCFMEKGQPVIGATEASTHRTATAAAAPVGAVPEAPQESLQPLSDSEPETAPEEVAEEQSLSANPTLPQHVRGARNGFISNTLVAKEMRRGNIAPNVDHACLVIPSKSISTTIRITETLSSYEYTVMDAIFALLDSGKTKFTLRNVLTMLSGDPEQVLSPQKRDQLSGIVEKLRRTVVNIDCAKEMEERKKGKKPEEYDFSGPLLSVEKKGNAYWFTDPRTSMPLCAYTKASTQYIRFPTTLLLAGAANHGQRKKLSDTDETVVIKHFLIARCEVLRNGKYGKAAGKKDAGFRTVSLETDGDLLRTLGRRKSGYPSNVAWQKRVKKVHDTVGAVLEYFKLIGYIDGWGPKGDFGFYIRAGENGDPGVNDPWKLFQE